MKQLTFFRNWYELAEAQTDDLKRLAYYDAIMRYAFDGEVPEKPSRRESGDKRAAYFAFLTVQPVIDSACSRATNAKKGAEKRWGKNAEHNAEHGLENHAEHNAEHGLENHAEHNAEHGLENHAEHNAEHVPPLEKNRIEKNRTSSRAGARGMKPPDTQKEFVDACVGMGIPEAFSAPLFDELRTNGWCDADGKPIGNWRMYTKSVYNERRNNPPPASDGMTIVRLEDL